MLRVIGILLITAILVADFIIRWRTEKAIQGIEREMHHRDR